MILEPKVEHPMNPWFVFLCENKSRIKKIAGQNNDFMHLIDIARFLWLDLSEEEKDRYFKKTQRLFEAYTSYKERKSEVEKYVLKMEALYLQARQRRRFRQKIEALIVLKSSLPDDLIYRIIGFI